MSKSARDPRAAAEEAPNLRKRLRKRRCNSCGLMYEADEVQPDVDEAGRRLGFVCDNCA